uniref:NADH-ubiquinone oxidoreductase chain 5 n=1 Tax=Cucullaea labiata TaxID=142556 RepID=A0A141AX69_9BIVA|nr:NADH dehydrogenase subunit 5 [Cucullaea labiata]
MSEGSSIRVVYLGLSGLLFSVSVLCSVVGGMLSCGGLGACFSWGVVSGGMSNIVELVAVVDLLSVSFSFVVCLISGSVVIYSMSYMSSAEESSRFLWVLFLFVVSMNLLLFFPSVLGLIIGWDGLGLSSFLLVVYYQNSNSLGSGMITALTNRLGDGLILLGIGISMAAGHWSLFFGGGSLMGVMWWVMVIASMTKSAQMPFCAWLPAAMAAPTPVSSLVHSSTLVTAGVYLLIRYSSCLNSDISLSSFLVVVGSFTMLMSGVGGIFEGDMKKVVALSTLSQLGMMVFILGLGFPVVCLFHVFMHALFKALLFMGVGCIIHCRGDQDIYKIGGSWLDVPGASVFIVLSCFALSGVPFMSGFFSKDVVVELTGNLSVGVFYFMGLILGVLLTVGYSFRLCWFIIGGSFYFKSCMHNGDCSLMLMSMVGLGLGAIGGGPIFGWCLGVFSVVSMELIFKLCPLVAVLFSMCCAVGMVVLGGWSKVRSGVGIFHSFCSQMWFLPLFSGEVCGRMGLWLGEVCVEHLESGWGEVMGGQGVFMMVGGMFSLSQRLQNFYLSKHLSFIFLGVFCLFFIGCVPFVGG